MVRVSHVNSLFRETSIRNPLLWTTSPSLNLPKHVLQVLIRRCALRPFCLSFMEDSATDPLSTWTVVANHVDRIQLLCLEIPEAIEGRNCMLLLWSKLPKLSQLRHCMVNFHGPRNVCLDMLPNPFDHVTHVDTLALSNCYITPHYTNFAVISSISIYYLGDPRPPEMSVAVYHYPLWSPQLKNLRRLVLWNCTETSLFPGSFRLELDLPLLEYLVLRAPFLLCEEISRTLNYPSRCALTLTSTFTGSYGAHDLGASAASIATFVRGGHTFSKCKIVVDRHVPSIYLRGSAACRGATLRFDLRNLVLPPPTGGGVPEAAGVISRFRAALIGNKVSICPKADRHPPNPLSIFSQALLRQVVEALSLQVAEVSNLHVQLPADSEELGRPTLDDLLGLMPQLHILCLDLPHTGAALPMAWTTGNPLQLPKLHQVLVQLKHGAQVHSKRYLAEFLRLLVLYGSPIREVLFVVSPRIIDTMGYASPDGLRLLLADLGGDFPRAIGVEWVEGSEVHEAVWNEDDAEAE
ncbi:hypothetical protein FA13DRAFT_1712905 [Coprinellus micaceus]|uniref:F-box domain-containing protein n=1 Tax=Coprinellus micaceus TaxID=71717 RepID=A0A4Y7SYI3_COPMI|nr:hypothetical protein FA13DRAFT_1712905 [Coprinellus micaceus]